MYSVKSSNVTFGGQVPDIWYMALCNYCKIWRLCNHIINNHWVTFGILVHDCQIEIIFLSSAYRKYTVLVGFFLKCPKRKKMKLMSTCIISMLNKTTMNESNILYTCNWGKYITYNDARRLKKKMKIMIYYSTDKSTHVEITLHFIFCLF